MIKVYIVRDGLDKINGYTRKQYSDTFEECSGLEYNVMFSTSDMLVFPLLTHLILCGRIKHDEVEVFVRDSYNQPITFNAYGVQSKFSEMQLDVDNLSVENLRMQMSKRKKER